MRRGDRAEAGGQEGFTLVEMLVTLAIVALTAAIGVQSIGRAAFDRRTAIVGELLAGEIGRLRAEAIRSGRGGRLAFEPQAARFVSSRAGSAPIPVGSMQVTVEARASDRQAPGEIRLLPDGSSTGGRIVLAAGGARRVLSISALTGRVRREEAP